VSYIANRKTQADKQAVPFQKWSGKITFYWPPA